MGYQGINTGSGGHGAYQDPNEWHMDGEVPDEPLPANSHPDEDKLSPLEKIVICSIVAGAAVAGCASLYYIAKQIFDF